MKVIVIGDSKEDRLHMYQFPYSFSHFLTSSQVSLVAHVVHIDRREKNIVYSLDDGTGMIDACQYTERHLPQENDEQVLCVSSLATATGMLIFSA